MINLFYYYFVDWSIFYGLIMCSNLFSMLSSAYNIQSIKVHTSNIRGNEKDFGVCFYPIACLVWSVSLQICVRRHASISYWMICFSILESDPVKTRDSPTIPLVESLSLHAAHEDVQGVSSLDQLFRIFKDIRWNYILINGPDYIKSPMLTI